MPNFNKVILAGNLVDTPETRQIGNDNSVTKFRIAVSRKYTSGNEKREEVGFFDCEAFGFTAVNIAKFFDKGRGILLEGRLKQDTWEDKETGQKRSKVLVHVDGFEFVDSNPSNKKDTPEPPKSNPKGNTKYNNRRNDENVPF